MRVSLVFIKIFINSSWIWDEHYSNKQVSFDVSNNRNILWQVVSKTPKTTHGFHGVQLQVGSLLKFSRYAFKVIEIGWNTFRSWPTRLSEELKNQQDRDEAEFEEELRTIEQEIDHPGSTKNICWRICLEPQSESSDPLICWWKCTGSVKNIHYSCFTQWIEAQR